MTTRLVIELAKYTGAVVLGITAGAITRPEVKKFFGLDKKKKEETIPSEDFVEEEVSEED